MVDISTLPSLALSTRQPWAHAIVKGWKDIENRNWNTSYRGPICIHASAFTRSKLEADFDDYREVIEIGVMPPADHEMARLAVEDLAFGAIIGVANIVDIRLSHPSPWFFGRYGFVLAEARMLAEPILVKGALGLFDWRQRQIGSAVATKAPPAQRSLF